MKLLKSLKQLHFCKDCAMEVVESDDFLYIFAFTRHLYELN